MVAVKKFVINGKESGLIHLCCWGEVCISGIVYITALHKSGASKQARIMSLSHLWLILSQHFRHHSTLLIFGNNLCHFQI